MDDALSIRRKMRGLEEVRESSHVEELADETFEGFFGWRPSRGRDVSVDFSADVSSFVRSVQIARQITIPRSGVYQLSAHVPVLRAGDRVTVKVNGDLFAMSVSAVDQQDVTVVSLVRCEEGDVVEGDGDVSAYQLGV